jgi:hypothetical protein
MRIRSLAWLAVAAQAVFVASWLVAGALQPGYSHADSYVSALAAPVARHPWIVMAGLAVYGLSAWAVAIGLRPVLPDRTASRVAVALFAVVGAAVVVAAFAQPDCNPTLRSCSESVHGWAAFVARLALVATPFALARALWPSPTAALALLAGGAGLAIGVLGLVAGGPDGTTERAELFAGQLWLIIVAAGILHETRPAPRFSAPAALRPRDFFGSTWQGEGRLRPFPSALSGALAPAVTVSRTTTWKSEDIGLVRDRMEFRSGRVEERLRFAHLVDPSHIHVTADDMPDGADLRLDEDGVRMAPFRLAVPVGPIRFVVRCHPQARVEPDGTLVYDVPVRWHGLPVARAELRARPVDTTAAPERAGATAPAVR